MRITKTFRAESSHIVRNCTSKRCSFSTHGHSYVIDVTLVSNSLDNAQMVADFGLMKGPIKDYIDSIDHCHMICDKDSQEYKEFFMKHNDRWVLLPFNPSAEMMALWFLVAIRDIVEKTSWANGERVRVSEVTVWETVTGRATAGAEDISIWQAKGYSLNDIVFSPGVQEEWSEQTKQYMQGETINNPIIPQQIQL